ncbi:hypothetical protein J6J08_11260 [Pseudidiomarina sp. 1APR75-33.1]|uniref:hypothetical protein n=1 Tax=Pseudidiomarina terrestris TaxID=2820060 RepID=UPI0026558204|nr:hypothetical protein [Pseudidiomarina sp. 1APR75-33.1]MDN7127949.1 hypothetical protein [Pseudidiomarina sp. 1APR75-33.1]
MGIRNYWPRIRRIWITVGISLTVVFVGWSLIAYRADAEAEAATISDDVVAVSATQGIWQFSPTRPSKSATLVFFPGALVDPIAYAPLARSVAAQAILCCWSNSLIAVRSVVQSQLSFGLGFRPRLR